MGEVEVEVEGMKNILVLAMDDMDESIFFKSTMKLGGEKTSGLRQ